jgi:hypothetical protein
MSLAVNLPRICNRFWVSFYDDGMPSCHKRLFQFSLVRTSFFSHLDAVGLLLGSQAAGCHSQANVSLTALGLQEGLLDFQSTILLQITYAGSQAIPHVTCLK